MSIVSHDHWIQSLREQVCEFTEPIDGWWPLENVQVGGRVGKLVGYGQIAKVLFGGYYMPPGEIEKFPVTALEKIHDRYNLRLRGDTAPPTTPKLDRTEVALANGAEIRKFVSEGWDTAGEWEWADKDTGKVLRRFTVRADGTVSRSFKVPPGSYEIRRRA